MPRYDVTFEFTITVEASNEDEAENFALEEAKLKRDFDSGDVQDVQLASK